MLKRLADYLKSEKGRDALAERLNRGTIWGLRALVFFFPIFVLPWPSLPLESMKAHFVVSGSLILLILWASGVMLGSKAVIRWHPILFGVLAYLGASALSALFSGSKYTAFLGLGGREMFSLLSIFSLALLTFLIGAITRRKADFNSLIFFAGLGIAVTGILELMQLAGAFPYPFAFTHQRIWSALGTPKIFAFLSGMGIILMLIYLRQVTLRFSLSGAVAVASILVNLLVLLRIDFYGAWILLAFGLVLYAAASYFGEEPSPLWDRKVPFALFATALVFTMIGSPLRQNLIPEFQLDPGTSWDVTFRGLKGNFLLGTGPGTFEFSYSSFRPVEFNSSPQWNTRFDRPGTGVMIILATGGALGLISWFAPLALFLFSLGYKLWRKKVKDSISLSLGTLLVIFFAVSFVFASNFALNFYTAILFGLSIAVLGKDWEIVKTGNARFRVSKFVFLTVLIVLSLRIGTHELMAAVGEFKLAQSQDLNKNLTYKHNALSSAMRFAGNEPRILRAFAKAALLLSNEEARAREVDAKKVQELLARATTAVKHASEVEGADVENWLALGAFYQNLLPFVEGSSEWVVRAYSEALSREPSNPLPRVEMGKSFLTLGDRMRQEGVAEDLIGHIYRNAEEELIKAIEVKADYAPAHFYLALIYDRQGREDDAVLKLEAVERFNPSDVGVAYELGKLYLRRGNLDKAASEFTRAIANLPSYSDARFQLAATLLRQGKPNDAIEQLKKILEYNPGNKNVERAIEEIKQGRTRL